MILQTTPEAVSWDPRYVCYFGPPPPGKYFALFVMIMYLVLLARSLRFWGVLGLTSSNVFKWLRQIHQAISNRNFSAATGLCARFPQRAPEAGLRLPGEKWPFAPGPGISQWLEQANRYFEIVAERLHESIESLHRWSYLLLILSFGAGCLQALHFLARLEMEKAVTIVLLASTLSEAIITSLIGLTASLAYGLTCAHFRYRLAHRRIAWLEFMHRAQQALAAQPPNSAD